MVDLALMTKLVEAVPTAARLMLLGDRDQLASVEAGAILGDICNVGGVATSWSRDFSSLVDEVTGDAPSAASGSDQVVPLISDCIYHLTTSFRFGEESGIGALSRAINRGDSEDAMAYLATEDTEHPEHDRYDDLDWVVVSDDVTVDAKPEVVLGRRMFEGYRPYLVLLHDPVAALAQFDRFRVICAHRRGSYGVDALNELVRAQLAREGLVSSRGEWYEGRPVMISRNDYHLGLFNGDIGLTVAERDTGQLRVHFLTANGEATRSFHPARLPAHETAFALTVHKSQGSEFDEVLFLLPRQISPIVSRELLYTGVTRARRRVTLVGSAAVIREAVDRRVRRASGLRAALWGDA
jgi:exodeoxyribonuclease V alpha subunit